MDMDLAKAMVLVVPLAFGFGFVTFGSYSHVAQTEAVEAAEPVDVVVLDKEVDRVRRSGSDSGSRYRYVPQVEYQYEVDGESYVDDTVYPAGITRRHSTRSAAEAEIERFHPGEVAVGFVDPDDPETSYLVDVDADSIRTRTIVMSVVGLPMLLWGLVLNFRWAARVED